MCRCGACCTIGMARHVHMQGSNCLLNHKHGKGWFRQAGGEFKQHIDHEQSGHELTEMWDVRLPKSATSSFARSLAELRVH